MEHNQQNSTMPSRTEGRYSPNILIYSEDEAAMTKFAETIGKQLDFERYTIYTITKDTLESGAWRGKTALLILIGNVQEKANLVLEYFCQGGKVFALHSDLLQAVFKDYQIEIKEEISLITCDKAKSAKMKHFTINCDKLPTDQLQFQEHKLKIEVLLTEEKRKSPSIIKVFNETSKGLILFAQLDLETKLTESVNEEGTSDTRQKLLQQIFNEVFHFHGDKIEYNEIKYTEGYFLGKYEEKLDLVKRWCSNDENLQKMEDMTIHWYLTENTPPTEVPTKTYLPVYLKENPENFSHDKYFGNLTSTRIGQLLIYSDILTSTMDIAKESLTHGIAIVASQQVSGRGRGGNKWITPLGQAAITIQIWLKMSPTITLIQHAAALAVALAIRKDYTDLEIGIKWPNDVYYGRDIKIGGVITTANCMDDDVIVNVGTGVNISNEVPTVCVNSIIEKYNNKYNKNLPKISIEVFLAKYCSEFERLLDCLEKENGVESFLQLYYKYWLHSNEEIKVKVVGGDELVKGTITGVDSAGWLLVKTDSGEITVTPDGNSFDMMTGLIAPK